MGGTLAGVTLDLPNSNLPQEAQDKINRDNVKGLQEVMKKSGVNVIFPQVTIKTATTIGTAAYVKLPSMQIAFVTSGGFVEIDALLSANTPSGAGIVYALIFDGISVDSSTQYGSASATVGRTSLKYAGTPAPGSHTLSIEAIALNSAATFTDPAFSQVSQAWGKETIL